MWHQTEITLSAKSRGFHLVTEEILKQVPEIKNFELGLANLFIQHTSASLTINENADPTVRKDFEASFNQVFAENEPFYKHTLEGSDDMPAHLKSSVLGCSLNIPITNGRLNLGTWQGIYFCEHRNYATARSLIITLNGE